MVKKEKEIMKYYSIGEIHRAGVIKTKKGTPYRHKTDVSKYLKRHKFKLEARETKYGQEMKVVSELELKKKGLII